LKNTKKQPHKSVGVRSQQKGCQKIELLESVRKSGNCRSTGPVDRQRSKIRPLGICGRPPGRPKQTESTVKCPGRLERRPTCTHAQLCTSVDRDGRPASVSSEKLELAETRNWVFGIGLLGWGFGPW